MNEEVRKLQPAALWNYFADINAVPRPSKKEERIIQFMKQFGEKLKLQTTTDEAGNVIIKKPASKGMEGRPTVVLQSHLDMVHQKNSDSHFDFNTQGIDMYVDGDWVKARGTTLGADNGIGVAAIMSILASTDIAHPPVEALFTIDEETGMTGALALKGGMLEGRILLNLDTEEDNELTIGCAGGVDVTATGTYKPEAPTLNAAWKISIRGLTGGHSGMDIYKGRANSNKLMNRLLLLLYNDCAIHISSVDGGSLRNAIPRESVAIITVAAEKSDHLQEIIREQELIFKAEYHYTDPNLTVQLESADLPSSVLPSDLQYRLLRSVYACPNGIYRMSPGIEGLVQSSNNIARVLIKDGSYSIQCLTRSAVDSEKNDLALSISSAFELSGAEIGFGGSYPGWEPRPDAPVVKLMSDLYKEMFGESANVDAVHAGLECGILGTNYPGMQMISFGPNITGAHSPDEKVQVSSVQKFWGFLLETLKRIA
ncbi:MAG: aminoacyl-histidine dipeptidase [Bacteroidetes bacterium]|nr:aminoacyl-histidine dipeptidase [Bacteroidota bacterium]